MYRVITIFIILVVISFSMDVVSITDRLDIRTQKEYDLNKMQYDSIIDYGDYNYYDMAVIGFILKCKDHHDKRFNSLR